MRLYRERTILFNTGQNRTFMMVMRDLLSETVTRVLLISCMIQSQTLSFMIDIPFLNKDLQSRSHRDITRDAILQATVEVCKFQGHKLGRDFVMVSN